MSLSEVLVSKLITTEKKQKAAIRNAKQFSYLSSKLAKNN